MSLFDTLIPRPAQVQPAGASFTLTPDTRILFDPGLAGAEEVARQLAAALADSGRPALTVLARTGPAVSPGWIELNRAGPDPDLGPEGYRLEIAPAGITISAAGRAGLFYGTQTLRQLAAGAGPASSELPGGIILDRPRFEWRGFMLDVARHFFGVADVKRMIDLAALYKLNRLHLHLTDDQGWRVEISSYPELTLKGGLTAVSGDPGGYYTRAEYAELAGYAASRGMILVPEIDLPGHTNAALACIPELNCSGISPAPYTGIEVGFSSLCIDKEYTYQFLDEVLGELAGMTPGPYLHIGGDEAHSTPHADYTRFIERVQGLVEGHAKQMVGWEEIGGARLRPNAIAQAWKGAQAVEAARQGGKVILSPASCAYLDMQYDEACPLGLHWAGWVEVQDSYAWEPLEVLDGLVESDILGVEAALWSETLRTIQDIEYMVFPRLPGLAEIGWSPAEGRSWETYRLRLAANGPRFAELGINFYRSPQVPW